MDVFAVVILVVKVDVSVFNPNAVLISEVLAFNAIAELSVDILLVNVAESAFNAIAVLRVFVLLVNIKSFCDFVYTSDILDFKAISEFNDAILLFNVTVSDFKAIAELRILKLLTVVVESVFKFNADCVAVDIGY